jgi:hypothetical protein
MYTDNSFSREQLKTGNRTFWDSIKDSILFVYRFGSKNLAIGILVGSLHAATQATFFVAITPSPIQFIGAGAFVVAINARNIAVIACLPFIEPAKIAIKNQVEIEMYNEKIKNSNVKQEKLDIVAKQYAGLMEKLLSTKLNFALECSECEKNSLSNEQAPQVIESVPKGGKKRKTQKIRRR